MLLGASVRKMAITAGLGIGFLSSTLLPNSAAARDGVVGAVGNAVGNAVGRVGGAVQSAVGGVQNAVGGVAGSTAPGGAISSSTGQSNNAGVAAAAGGVAKTGNWISAPYILKKAQRSEHQEICRSAAIASLAGQPCDDISIDVPRDALNQASYTDDNEPVLPSVKTGKPTPKSAQRPKLPVAQKPKLTLARESTEPKTDDARKPKSPSLLSCKRGESIVGSYGFSEVQSSDCDGQVYSFNARRDGKDYSVTLNATNGELVSVRKLPATPPPQYE